MVKMVGAALSNSMIRLVLLVKMVGADLSNLMIRLVLLDKMVGAKQTNLMVKKRKRSVSVRLMTQAFSQG